MAIPVVKPTPEAKAEPLTRRRQRGGLLSTRRQRRDLAWALLFIGPQLLGMIVFSLFPVISAFVLSVMKWDGLGDRAYVGMDNFTTLFSDSDFRAALRNTLLYTVIVVPGTVILSLAIALGVNRVRGKTFYRTVFFLPTITSSVAISMVWLWILNGDFGLLNLFLREGLDLNPPNWLVDRTWVIPVVAMVSIWAGIGFNMVIFLAGLQGIPATYIEAAQIDGAGRWRTFWNITLPLLSPTVFFVTIITIIGSFQVFDLIYVMTRGGPGNASTTMVFHVYELAFVDFTFGLSSAAAVILFGLIMIVTLFQFWGQRRWVHYDA